jgi:hypothetical protein
VKKRIGDRRGRARYEIVGTLTGTVETWQRYRLLNLGPGGAAIESAAALPLGTRITGRLTIRGRQRDIRGEVRHLTARGHGGSARYELGIEWTERLVHLEEILAMDPGHARTAPRPGLERRRSVRVIPGSAAEIGRPVWSTVELLDISESGVLLVSAVPMQLGEKGQLRVRLGQRSFAAQIEARRSDSRPTAQGQYKVGAVFAALDEASRFTLSEFLGTGH